MKKYYVYAILDPTKPSEYWIDNIKLDFEIFYIGKGTSNRITSTLSRSSRFKMGKIDKIKKLGFKPIVQILYNNLLNEESLEIEIRLIKLIGRRNLGLGPLVNLTDGGEDRISEPVSVETKDKISNSKKGKPGTPHTQETKDHLREVNMGDKNPMYGKNHTDDIKQKQSDSFSGKDHGFYGKKHSEESLKIIKDKRNQPDVAKKIAESNAIHSNKRKSAVLQYDLEGNFIREYESIKEAHEVTKFSHISCVCLGKMKSIRGFVFKFKDPSLVMTNQFKISVGDKFVFNNIEYILVKRFKSRCEVLNSKNETEYIKYTDLPLLKEKKSRN